MNSCLEGFWDLEVIVLCHLISKRYLVLHYIHSMCVHMNCSHVVSLLTIMSQLCKLTTITSPPCLCRRNCKTFGAQSWISSALIITEALVSLKFDWDTLTRPLPRPVAIVWMVGLSALALWTLWHFYLQRLLFYTEYKLTVRQVSQDKGRGGRQQGEAVKLRQRGKAKK